MKDILVIEDSKIINNILKKELTKLNFNVSQAFTLKEAKELLNKENFDLIILDLHLPDGEGIELISEIKSLTKTKVIVLTGVQDVSLREELFHFGILDYIIKDKNLIYSISEIIKVINHLQTNKNHILIIDELKFICRQIESILAPRNYKVDSANLAKEGLKKAKENKYDLIILDMELPDLHGLKVLEELRKEFIDLPIIVLSGTSTADTIRNLLKNGANDYIKKPFIYEEFILKVDLWIDYYKQKEEIKKKNEKLKELTKNLEKRVKEEVAKSKKQEELLLIKSKHSEIGEMISIIFHQWKQPINTIKVATNLLKLQINDNIKIKTAIEKIEKSLEFMNNTIETFKGDLKVKPRIMK